MLKILFLGWWLLEAVSTSYTTKTPVDPCEVYGNIYIDETDAFAHCRVALVEDEVSAQLPVFIENNSLFANESGKWHLVSSRGLADYIVYVEKSSVQADFTIFFTETASFAGCK
ncbi:MAG: hypothetical protein ACFB0B_01010 [Thermonemataceae bacterium]